MKLWKKKQEARANTIAVRTTTGSRTIRAPKRLIEEIGAVSAEEMRWLEAMNTLAEFEINYGTGIEVGCLGAGIGGGFDDTNELKVVNFKSAMNSESKTEWMKAIEDEHNRMLKHDVWTAVNKKDVPSRAKIIGTTWVMKKKSNGTFRARVTGVGYRQIDGEH